MIVNHVEAIDIDALANGSSSAFTLRPPAEVKTFVGILADNSVDLRVTVESRAENKKIIKRHGTKTPSLPLLMNRTLLNREEFVITVENRSGSAYTGAMTFLFA